MDDHVRVVPELLRWTQFDEMDRSWIEMRCEIARSAAEHTPGAMPPRHLRIAHILEFVGARAAAEGRSFEECVELCRRASVRSTMGQLEPVIGGRRLDHESCATSSALESGNQRDRGRALLTRRWGEGNNKKRRNIHTSHAKR